MGQAWLIVNPEAGGGRGRQHAAALSAVLAEAGLGCTVVQPTSGEGTVQFQSPTAYTGQFKIKTTGLTGKPEQIDMAQQGQWLSGECGAIKPALTVR